MQIRTRRAAMVVALLLVVSACGSGAAEPLAGKTLSDHLDAGQEKAAVASEANDASSAAGDTGASDSATAPEATDTAAAETPTSVATTTAEDPETTVAAANSEAPVGWVDVSAENYAPCDVLDDETYLVEVFNSGEQTADYELAVVFFNDDGSENQAAAGTQLIPSLRPGERAVQEGWSLFDGTGESCIVTTIQRAVSSGDAPEPEDRCTVLGVAASGFVDFEVEVIGTHDGEVWPMVAFFDAEGVRRATIQGLIKELAIGQLGTVADANISGVEDPTIVACAVVSRTNF